MLPNVGVVGTAPTLPVVVCCGCEEELAEVVVGGGAAEDAEAEDS